VETDELLLCVPFFLPVMWSGKRLINYRGWQMKIFLLVGLLAFVLAGCAMPGAGLVDEKSGAGLVDEKSVLITAERTKREIERTRREELKTEQFKMYYGNRGPEAESLAGIAAEGGPAADVAAAEVSSAAPPGAVFRQPVPRSGKKSELKKEALIKPAADPVCGEWVPPGLMLCAPE
jgi:hypothetical protein